MKPMIDSEDVRLYEAERRQDEREQMEAFQASLSRLTEELHGIVQTGKAHVAIVETEVGRAGLHGPAIQSITVVQGQIAQAEQRVGNLAALLNYGFTS